jgi:hypothetical protein
MQQRSGRKAHTMRRKYFGWGQVFEFIWRHCDRDGLWDSDAETVAAKFNVSEDEARDAPQRVVRPRPRREVGSGQVRDCEVAGKGRPSR